MLGNIVLIGMPASGKSTIGVVLAKSLMMNFVDTDIVIQEDQKKKLQDIIDEEGLDVFHVVEEKILSALDLNDTVISTGGSAVYYNSSMEHLKKNGKVVYLQVPLEEIKKRLLNIKTRGISMGPGETIDSLYQERIPLYEKYADIILECEGKTVEEIVTDIISLL